MEKYKNKHLNKGTASAASIITRNRLDKSIYLLTNSTYYVYKFRIIYNTGSILVCIFNTSLTYRRKSWE